MKYFYLSFLLINLLAPNWLMAQAVAAENTEIPLYDVEIVIFKNVKVPKDKEFTRPLSLPSRAESRVELSDPGSLKAAEKLQYNMLSVDDLRLMSVVEGIVKSSRYQLLLHAGWRQPGLEKAKVLPIWIKGGQIYGGEYTSIDNKFPLPQVSRAADSRAAATEFSEQDLELAELAELAQPVKSSNGLYELEGKITIALARYLHTYADLVLRRPRLAIDQSLNSAAEDQQVAEYAPDTRILNNHSLKEHRRMRSKTLHYLDSPEFSLVILITPFKNNTVIEEDPKADEAEPAATAAAVVE